MPRALTLLSLLLVAAPAAAQRHTEPVADVSDGVLASLVYGQRGAIERCARGEDTGAYVVEVRARVRPGPSPSTLYNARIHVDVRSRPRDLGFERCARRSITDMLRHQPYAVGPRGADARQTFRVDERPEPPPRHDRPPLTEADVRRLLDGRRGELQRCLEIAGVPERVTLRVAADPNARLSLINADLPSGASRDALSCMARAVSRIRAPSAPARRIQVVYALSVRASAH